MKELELAASTDDKDSDWKCDTDVEGVSGHCSNALVDEKGEVRFPLRSWITPKKIDLPDEQRKEPKIPSAQSLERRKSLYAAKTTEERSNALTELEEKRKRTLEKLRSDVPTTSSRALGKVEKLKRANVKAYKIPASNDHEVVSNKDKILQRSNIERSRPTPLKLIPSTSKRKNATPRKIVYLEKIPTLSPAKRANFKRVLNNAKKTTTKSKDSVQVVQVAEQVTPETVVVKEPEKEVPEKEVLPKDAPLIETPDETPNSSLNNTSSDALLDVETVDAMEVVPSIVEESPTIGDDSEFFIEQEVEETVVKSEDVEVPRKLFDSEDEEEYEGEAELEFALSASMESFTFNINETSKKPSESKIVEDTTRCPLVYEINDVKHTISDSETQVLFSMDPSPVNIKKTKVEEPRSSSSSSRHHTKSTDRTKSKTDNDNPVGSKSSKPMKVDDKKKKEVSKKPLKKKEVTK